MSRDCDVLIVGAGPVGLSAALLLNKAGIRTVLVEKRSSPVGHPSGHVINPRSLEIWRQSLQGLDTAILSESAAIEDLRYVVWCTNLSGAEIGRIRTVPEQASELAERMTQSPGRHAHYPQSLLEKKLWGAVEGASNIRFLHGNTLKKLEITDRGVSASIASESSSEMITARYCLAADGARSQIREQLGIAMPGPVMMRVASIHFTANLNRFIQGRPGVIYWIYNQKLVGPLIRHIGDEWILMSMLHPPQKSEHFTEEHWRELITEAIGSCAVDVKIKAIGTWAMTAQLADRMRQGPVFLVGDAAHRFPPTGGYGINTGVQDVHNLVWKLKAVLNGDAGEALLDTYESERKPVAQKNCKRSIDNQEEMDSINAAVALRAEEMKKVHDLMESRPFRALSEARQLKIAAGITRLGLRKIASLEKSGRRGDRLRSRLSEAAAAQRAHFGGAHGVDLGYQYNGSLTLDCPFTSDELSTSDLEYKPSTVPGMRLPHAWLECAGEKISTIDIFDYDAFQLIVDAAWADDWAKVLDESKAFIKYPIRLVPIGASEDDALQAFDSDWTQKRGVSASGAILVRPDGHVSWRTRSLPENPVAALTSALVALNKAFGN